MKLFVLGATGLLGRRLVPHRLGRGDEVLALTRDATRARRRLGDPGDGLVLVEGDPNEGGDWQRHVDGCDAVVNFAGAGIADRRWNARYKERLESSRVLSTRNLVEAIRVADARPRVLINASAVGYYGDTGDREVDETAPPGDDFLARVCVKWEREAQQADALDVRVALLRISMVLDPGGGALAKLIPPFRMFVGGPIGSGRFHMSWIHGADVIGLIDLALDDERAQGPINAAAPGAVTNRAFSRALGRALRRPSWLPVPRLMLRLVLGEVSKYITMSQRIVPARARELGYEFTYGEVPAALEAVVQARRARRADAREGM